MPEDIYHKHRFLDIKVNDLSNLSNTKRSEYPKQKKYSQTFENDNGFISDLSIIDLIFSCGPNSLNYF